MKKDFTDLNKFHGLPPLGSTVWMLLILLIITITILILYVRSRTRIGFNDIPPADEEDEDNTIIQIINNNK